MAKKRFNLIDTMEEVNNFIQTPKEEPKEEIVENGIDGTNEDNGPGKPNESFQAEGQSAPTPETKEESRVGEGDPTVPNAKYKRNVTLSEELLWRLNYIKERKNKSRAKGDKFVTVDQLMFEMVQFALDEKFASTKKKFLESKEDEEEFL